MELGEFTPAKENDANAWCMIENRVGMGTEYPELEERRNQAAHKIIEPQLRMAINRDFLNQLRMIREKELDDYKGELRALGVEIS
jgi:hypothetical protein